MINAFQQAKDLFQNALPKIKNIFNPVPTAQNIVNQYREFPNALQQARNNFQRLPGTLGQAAKNFAYDLPANSAYLQAKIAQRIAPRSTIPEADQFKMAKPDYKSLYIDWGQGPTKNMSAELNPWPEVPNTPYNQQLAQIKQKVLNSGIFRPAMKRYLETVPVYGEYGNPGGGSADVTPLQTFHFSTNSKQNKEIMSQPWEYFQGPYQPVIEVGITKEAPYQNNERTESVMLHELVHSAPRNMALKDQFIDFFNSVNPETQPELYKVGLTYFNNGQPPPNPEEFYATLAQQLGPKVFEIPEIKRYYENIFR